MSWFKMKPTLTEEDRVHTKKAEEDLVDRKDRGAVIQTEISGIIKRNHFAEKFHQALGGK